MPRANCERAERHMGERVTPEAWCELLRWWGKLAHDVLIFEATRAAEEPSSDERQDPETEASAEEVRKALTGNWREEHLFVLTQALAMYDSLAQRIGECDAKTQALLAPLGREDIDLARRPRSAANSAPRSMSDKPWPTGPVWT